MEVDEELQFSRGRGNGKGEGGVCGGSRMRRSRQLGCSDAAKEVCLAPDDCNDLY